MKHKIITSKGLMELDIPLNPRLTSEGEHYLICPICTQHRQPKHQKERKFAINLKKPALPWRCNHCGESGYVLNDDEFSERKIKKLDTKFNFLRISDPIAKFFLEERKISAQTLRDFDIKMTRESMKQMRNPNTDLVGEYVSSNCINYKYIFNGELINIKYRDRHKNFKMIAGASKVFYNMDSMRGQKYVVITEGENDVLAYHESGIKSVISVPNGVVLTVKEREIYEKTGKIEVMSDLNMEYLDNTIDMFDGVDTIFIATDDDAAGIKLREELSRRLGKEKCRYIRFSDYKDDKDNPINDPNDLLIFQGKDVLKNTLVNSYRYPLDNVTTAKDHLDSIMNIYDNGKIKGLSSGYKSLDPHFNWMRGWLYIGNGYPGEGKSTFMFNLMLITSVLYKWSWGVYSPENYPIRNIIDTMAEIMLGNTSDISSHRRADRVSYKSVIEEHINKHFYFVDNEEGYTPDQLREKKEEMVKRYGIVGFLTDPWKNLIQPRRNMDRDEYIQQQLNHEVRLSLKHNLVNVINHHPPTPPRDKEKTYKAPSAFELIGGQIWFSTSYGMFCIHKEDRVDWTNTNAEVHIQKIKEHKLAGWPTNKTGPVILKFDRLTNRFLEKKDIANDSCKEYVFPVDDYMSLTQLDFEF